MSCCSDINGVTVTSQLPGSFTFVFYQGATFNPAIYVEANGIPVNYTGYTAEMTLRDASNNIILQMTTSDAISFDSNGNIIFDLSAASTAALPVGTYDYDLLLTSGGNITIALLSGSAVVIGSPSL